MINSDHPHSLNLFPNREIGFQGEGEIGFQGEGEIGLKGKGKKAARISESLVVNLSKFREDGNTRPWGMGP